MDAPPQSHRPPGTVCKADECRKLHEKNGYCGMHNRRMQRHGHLDLSNNQWPVGSIRKANEQGYLEIKLRVGHAAGNWKLQHRYVMEQSIGRQLLPRETVHHINGDRSDNRTDNLELYSHSHPAGQRVIDKIRWAEEILALYARQRELFE